MIVSLSQDSSLVMFIPVFIKIFEYSHRYDALSTTVEMLPTIVETLQLMISNVRYADSSGQAQSLLNNLTSSKFIVSMVISSLIIGSTNDLCLKLQGQ